MLRRVKTPPPIVRFEIEARYGDAMAAGLSTEEAVRYLLEDATENLTYDDGMMTAEEKREHRAIIRACKRLLGG